VWRLDAARRSACATAATAAFTSIALQDWIRELHEPFPPPPSPSRSAARNCGVAALQKRWDRLRVGLDLILDQRAAEMADVPGGASGMPAGTTRERKRPGW
jgi:hypothetical protein